MLKNLAVGVVAHVDAGKTTLLEALLYKGECIKSLGRVDHGDAFLDTDSMERRRGITIFSKQAVLPLGDTTLTLIDTPGHVDFSAEMERTLQVLDYAVLVINASDGVQGHTVTLWQLLERYNIPVFLFINKMDIDGTSETNTMAELKNRLDDKCVSFTSREDFCEEVAMCDEHALNSYLEQGSIDDNTIAELIKRRNLFPCFFGSALKLDGIDELLSGIKKYSSQPQYYKDFAAKVYKISRDAQGTRLTHIKITGGSLTVKEALTNAVNNSPQAEIWTEKVNQIRIYSGEKYSTAECVQAGSICAVTGLNHTFPGQGLGGEIQSSAPTLQPVLSYRVKLPEGYDVHAALRNFRQLEEEDPQLAVSWTEHTQEIHLSLMGEVQLEIISNMVMERFGVQVEFDTGSILYRETIAEPIIGMGHFEPLRHYAEVHLLLEPLKRGSGLQFASVCSEDVLARNWQRLIMTHLEEREHIGVLTGSPVIDMKITLTIGRAHNKHTDGGDFRQATYRAIRHGLMRAKSVLLEPWYKFQLDIPSEAVGRAMTDLQRVSSDISLPQGNGERTVLTGSAPVAVLRDYGSEVTAYTRGRGRLACSFIGFAPCHNESEVIAQTTYDPERDMENTADSVFCSHGAGVTVKWTEAESHMHLDSSAYLPPPQVVEQAVSHRTSHREYDSPFELDKELQEIYERTYGPVKQRDVQPQRTKPVQPEYNFVPRNKAPVYSGPDYLLVDGYNIVHAWDDLRAVAKTNMDAARQVLMDALSNYHGYSKREIIVVFDAYRVEGGTRNTSRYHGIHVVYTKEAETADSYIEKVTYELSGNHRVSVATSDGTVQMIILGHGALRVTPSTLREEIEQSSADIKAIISALNSRGHSTKLNI